MQFNLYTAYPLFIVVDFNYTDLANFYNIMADFLLFSTVKFKFKKTSEEFTKYRKGMLQIFSFLMK